MAAKKTGHKQANEDAHSKKAAYLDSLSPGVALKVRTTIQVEPNSIEMLRRATAQMTNAAKRHGLVSWSLEPAGKLPGELDEFTLTEEWKSAGAYASWWRSNEVRAFLTAVFDADPQNVANVRFYPQEKGDSCAPTANQVPQTGQTDCWDETYEKLADPSDPKGKGQDGRVRAGKAWPRRRFEEGKDGPGTVTDTLTNLVWLKDADYYGEKTWDEALQLASKLCDSEAGLGDDSEEGAWRVPNIRELLSLIDYGMAAPILPAGHEKVFVNTGSGKYWTSSTLIAAPRIAWFMTLGIAPTVFDVKRKDNKNHFWPVRNGPHPSLVQKTGQTLCFSSTGDPLSETDPAATGQDGQLQIGLAFDPPEKRFEEDEDGEGTVTDHLTGLVWLKNANPFGFLTWQDALEACNALKADDQYGLNDGSKEGDWRLPNIREIESLVDYGRAGPCLPDGHPFGQTVKPSSYWTSTSVTSAPSQAMFIILGVGPSIFEFKEHAFFAWPVRDRRASS